MIRLLRHAGGLGMAPPAALPPAAPEAVARAAAATLVSFRAPAAGPRPRPIVVDATSRPFAALPPEATGEIHVHALEQDSPLAPLLLWDLAHAVPVGARIVTEAPPADGTGFLQRGYFRPHFAPEPPRPEIPQPGPGTLALRKISPLPAEAERGLDAWTFGIPVGPEDATLLNAVVERVLALDVAHKEILLCGRPGANFAHSDRVRIVGLDLPPPPPLNISAKKNRLAREARYGNLCLFHDRVLLPRDFGAAMARFGDDFPFLAFQSLWFDDHFGLLPRRYSDLGHTELPPARHLLGLARGGAPAGIAPGVLAEAERSGFVLSHPRRHVPGHSFVNGSLCIAKRAVWQACPQDENLYWTEFEDVEHGLRAAALGIPSRCNPHAFTVSLSARPIQSIAGAVRAEGRDGVVRTVRLPLEPLPLPRKPLIRLARAEAEARLEQFAARYVPGGLPVPRGAGWRGRHGVRARLDAVIAAVHGAALPRTVAAAQRFVADFERLVLLDQIAYGRRHHLTEILLTDAAAARRALIEDSPELINMVAQRPRGPLFHESLTDYLPRGRWRWRLAPAVAATLLWAGRSRCAHHPDGWRGLRRALRAALPDPPKPAPAAGSGPPR